MTSTLRIPLRIEIEVVVHPVEGGGFWGEVPRCPGCLAQAETEDELRVNILQALEDWWAEVSEKTEDDARKLAEIQGIDDFTGGPYPRPYDFIASPSWSEDDE